MFRKITRKYILSSWSPKIPTWRFVLERIARALFDRLETIPWFAISVKVLSVQLASSPPTQANAILMKFSILRITCTIVSAKNANSLLKRIKVAITWPANAAINFVMSVEISGLVFTTTIMMQMVDLSSMETNLTSRIVIVTVAV